MILVGKFFLRVLISFEFPWEADATCVGRLTKVATA